MTTSNKHNPQQEFNTIVRTTSLFHTENIENAINILYKLPLDSLKEK